MALGHFNVQHIITCFLPMHEDTIEKMCDDEFNANRAVK